MLSKGEFVVGLDIGSGRVTALVAEIIDHQGGFNVVGMGESASRGMEHGVVNDIQATTDAVATAIREASDTSGVQIGGVYLSTSGSHVRGENAAGRTGVESEVTDEHVAAAVHDARVKDAGPDREHLCRTVQAYKLDEVSRIVDPRGMRGAVLGVNVHHVTGSRVNVHNLRRCCEKAGLIVESVVPSGLCAALATTSLDERDLGVAVIDLGSGTADLAVYNESSIVFTGGFDAGGLKVVRELARVLCTSTREAERVLQQHGSAVAERIEKRQRIDVMRVGTQSARQYELQTVCHTIQMGLEEVFRGVGAMLRKTGFAERLDAGVVLTGGLSVLPLIDELAETCLEFPVRVGRPQGFSTDDERVYQPAYATAVGLLRYGAEHGAPSAPYEEPAPVTVWGRWFDRMRAVFTL